MPWAIPSQQIPLNLPGPLTTKLAMKVKTQNSFSSEDATSLAATVTPSLPFYLIYVGGLPWHQS